MIGLLITLAAAYAVLLVALTLAQRLLIYHPDKSIGPPAQYGLSHFDDITTVTSDKVTLQLWYAKAQPGMPTVVYYHGNSYNLSDRAGIYGALAGKGLGVLALSYRGYGRSQGSPSEQGLYNDARAAIAYLTKKGVPLGRIILFGESLGTGVATRMATEYDVGGLVLQAPYTSVVNRAAEIYRLVPVRILLRDRFDTLSRITQVKCPLMIFHGERDPTIPIAHGKALLEAAICQKKAYFFPDRAHNDFDSAVISSHVLDFAKENQLTEA